MSSRTEALNGMIADRLNHLQRWIRPTARSLWLLGLLAVLALALLLHATQLQPLPLPLPVAGPTLPPTGEPPGGTPGIADGQVPPDRLPIHDGLPIGERDDEWDPPPPTTPPAPEPARPPGRVAYLTFDDGPSLNTPRVLDILKEYDVKATFFVCGNVTKQGRDIYQRIIAEGHAIGNHTFSHRFESIYVSADAFWADFLRQDRLIKDATGVTPEIMRFPGGSNNGYARRAVINEIIAGLPALGYQYFDWNVDSGDALVFYQEVDVIISRVLTQSSNKRHAVILMHDSMTRTATVEALPVVLDGLISMGFTFATLDRNSVVVQFRK